MPHFNEVVPKFMEIDRGWPELLVEMRDILKPAQITVLPYERRGSSRDLLTRLVPDLRGKDLSEPQRTMNLSATDAALIALQARLQDGEKLAEKQRRRVIANHADDREPRGYAAFSAPDAATLDARYLRDQDRIADMDGITFI